MSVGSQAGAKTNGGPIRLATPAAVHLSPQTTSQQLATWQAVIDHHLQSLSDIYRRLPFSSGTEEFAATASSYQTRSIGETARQSESTLRFTTTTRRPKASWKSTKTTSSMFSTRMMMTGGRPKRRLLIRRTRNQWDWCRITTFKR